MQIVAVLLIVSLITKNSEIHLMNTILLEPRKALNKAFPQIKPNRTIESLKTNLIQILDSINEKESEEFP
jgi:hypothetical protein